MQCREVEWWRACVNVKCRSVCIRMGPLRRDKCSGAPHWPVGRKSLTGQDVLRTWVPCETTVFNAYSLPPKMMSLWRLVLPSTESSIYSFA